jgi:hypothetical protein
LISFPEFVRLSEGYFQSIDEIPLQNMFIQIYNADDVNVTNFKKDLKNLIRNNNMNINFSGIFFHN